MTTQHLESSSDAAPRFVVVGHPNKGKSSVVATLAQDDAVRIAPEPGTTTSADPFELRIDGRLLYSLIDTPGFQRARAVLAWLREHETDAAEHPAVVRRFVQVPGHAERFPDEVALLAPLVDSVGPTGILYVVDGSTPYGPEYEPEMEILRWTGRPGMALVNPIGTADHVEQWRRALGQFFGTVRVFNAVKAPWAKRIELLEAFGELDEAWRPTVRAGTEALRADRAMRQRQCAELIADSLVAALRLRIERRLGALADAKDAREALEAEYREKLAKLERDTRDRVEEAYGFLRLQRKDESDESVQSLLGDLFAESTWNRLGLSRSQLLAAGSVSAAGGGFLLDLAAHGLSFGLFTASGAVLGAAGAWWGSGKLPETKVLGLPMGGKLAGVGPMQNPNFPFVWLGRARLHHRFIAQRTHARRDTLTIETSAEVVWDTDARKALVQTLGSVMKKPESDEIANAARGRVARVFGELLRGDVDAEAV